MNQFHLLCYKWKWQQVQRRSKSKTTPKREWFCMWRPQTDALSPSWLILHKFCVLLLYLLLLVAWGGTCSPIILLQSDTFIRAVTRRFAVSPSAVSRAWRRYQESSVFCVVSCPYGALCWFNVCALCNTFELCSRNTVNIYLPTCLVFYLCFIHNFHIVYVLYVFFYCEALYDIWLNRTYLDCREDIYGTGNGIQISDCMNDALR